MLILVLQKHMLLEILGSSLMHKASWFGKPQSSKEVKVMDKGFYLLKLVQFFLCMESKRLWEGKQFFMFHYAFKFGKLIQMQVGYGKIF